LKKIQNDASNEVEKMKQAMQSNMEKDIVEIAFNATEALLQKKIDHNENQKLVKKFIKDFHKGGKTQW
jgi:F0F1-type ATP synthase membrane subunit b/b'